MTAQDLPEHANDLVLTRLLDIPADRLYRCWTEPALIQQWFAPSPWSVSCVDNDVRPGGHSLIVMRSPEGQEMPGRGVYLEVIPNRRLVFTDAFTQGWVPADKPFMTGIVSFDPEGAQTRYTARVRHWSAADRTQHEAMGFHTGWGQCTDQLAELAARL